MAAKKNNYISVDLDFAETQLETWKQFVLDNPYSEVEDRFEMKTTKTGGSFQSVVQTREAIQKNLRDTMKDYLALLEVVKRLREVEEKKQELARGGHEIPSRMRKLADEEDGH